MTSIKREDVCLRLVPFLGSRFVAQSGIDGMIADYMRRAASRHTPLDSLAKELESILFRELYRLLGARMTLTIDHGRTRRIRTEDLPAMADWVLYPFLCTYPVNDLSCSMLREYAMRSCSQSAMLVLHDQYQDYLSEGEKTMIARIARDIQNTNGGL